MNKYLQKRVYFIISDFQYPLMGRPCPGGGVQFDPFLSIFFHFQKVHLSDFSVIWTKNPSEYPKLFKMRHLGRCPTRESCIGGTFGAGGGTQLAQICPPGSIFSDFGRKIGIFGISL